MTAPAALAQAARAQAVAALGGHPGVMRLRRLPRRATAALRPLPDFLVVGAQKSGTTTLYDYIAQHPDVRASLTKEVHYFDTDVHRGAAWYRASFPLDLRAGGSRPWLTGEASPYYLLHPLVPRRAAALVPGAKVLMILRHPVDRAYSHYQHEVAKGHEHLSFEQALAAEPERTAQAFADLAAGRTERSDAVQQHTYVARGRYDEQVTRWLVHYPRRQLLAISAEQLFREPEPVMSGVFSFLGLSPDAAVQYRRLNSRSYDELSDTARARLGEEFRGTAERLNTLLGTDFAWPL